LLAVAIVGYRYQLQRTDQEQVANFLAQAAGERRVTKLRMAGAPHAILAQGLPRGGDSTFLNAPGALLKAEALIHDQILSHPSDPVWLRAKAQADLLDGRFDAAAASLTRALELDPKSPEILTDLATARFQQKNYAAAYEALSQVLSVRPDDLVALFNRAMVAQDQFLFRQALADWKYYLTLDSSSEWAEEARKNEETVRQKLQNHDQSRAAPLLGPAQLAVLRDDPEGLRKVDQHIEEYLDTAIRDWLPKAYPGSAPEGDPAARQALFFLADLTSRQHGDLWLHDLLLGANATQFPQGAAALARASVDNDAGAYDRAREQARSAEQWFRASGNIAGELRAQFEEAFSGQLLRDIKACAQSASAALGVSEKYSYHWLHIQLGLEKSVCLGFAGDMGGDEKGVHRALERAQLSGYHVLELRALAFAVDDKLETGDPSAAWQLGSVGLERYWSEPVPAMRGYSLYVECGTVAESIGQSNLQLAAFSEAVALIDSDQDLHLRAMAHAALATAAIAAHQPRIAELQFAETSRLFALAPQTDAVRDGRIENEIRLSQIEARQNKFDNSLTRLTRIQSEIQRFSNPYFALMFYANLGEVQLRRNHPIEAEQALWAALQLAESRRASLKQDTERLKWNQGAAPVYLALAEAQLVQGRQMESLETYQWFLNAARRGGTGHGETQMQRTDFSRSLPKSARLASRLPSLSSVTVLAYGLLPDGLAIWAFDDRGVYARWFPGSTQDLQDLSSRFHDLSSDPRSEMSAVRRDARSLYQRLIAPVEERLAPDRTLVIEGESSTSSLPFEAFLDPNGRYLVERTPIVHSLGQNPEDWPQHDVGISPSLPALVVGSTASSQVEGLVQLPDVSAEADAVAGSFHSALELKGAEATLARVKQGLSSAAVFHFAGHSRFTPDNSGLMLADRGVAADYPRLLDADALRGVNLKNMRMAVLSACSTASGSGGSRGFSGITEAFLHAGVPHVIASRWAVDSTATHSFVEDYYHNLLSGSSVSQATRLTSQTMLANSRTSHPYYWSAFAAYGRP
jgi:CHAT domain-containing protein/tetratricopeptide (TPR) repeat protein